MEIIDAQIHEPLLWTQFQGESKGDHQLVLEIALAQMDGAGVSAAVVCTHDLEWAAYAADASKGRIIAMPSGIDMAAPDIDEQVDAWLGRPGIFGIRIFLLGASPHWNVSPQIMDQFESGAFDRFFEVWQKRQIPLMVGAFPEVGVVGKLAAAFPEMTLLLDHLGIPQPPLPVERPPFKKLAAVLALSRHPNVSVKLTGAPTVSMERYPFRDLWVPLQQLLDAFGSERLVWGSDIQRVNGRMARYPNSGYGAVGAHTYAEAARYLLEADWLSQADRSAILGANIRRLLRWAA